MPTAAEAVLLALARPGVIQPPVDVKPADHILLPVDFPFSLILAKAGAMDKPLAAAVVAKRDETGAVFGPENGEARSGPGSARGARDKAEGGPFLVRGEISSMAEPASCCLWGILYKFPPACPLSEIMVLISTSWLKDTVRL